MAPTLGNRIFGNAPVSSIDWRFMTPLHVYLKKPDVPAIAEGVSSIIYHAFLKARKR